MLTTGSRTTQYPHTTVGLGYEEALAIFIDVIQSYYPGIDLASHCMSTDLKLQTAALRAQESISNIWDERAEYIRAGLSLICAENIRAFYSESYPRGRAGLVGTHSVKSPVPITNMRADCLSLVVVGTFQHKDGWQLGFLDLWQAQQNNPDKVIYRETFLQSPQLDQESSAAGDGEIIGNFQTQGNAAFLIGQVSIQGQQRKFASLLSFSGLNLQGQKYWNCGVEILKP